jgi:transcriptional regulator with XRE-family HTH domain
MKAFAATSRSRAHLGLGLAVRETRRERGLTQYDLAEATGLHVTYVSGVERGRRNPGYGFVVALSEALGVKPGALVTLADELTPQL